MIHNILFAIVGIGLIALGLSLVKLDSLVESWRVEVLHHTKLLNDLDNKRFEDSCRLSRAYERIQVLEERLEGQEALTSELEKRVGALEEGSGEYFKSQL